MHSWSTRYNVVRSVVDFVLQGNTSAGTGKTHTLIEIIQQILLRQSAGDVNEPPRRVLVCGASNLSVDNILERLLLIPHTTQGRLRCTRLGHPARVMGTDEVLSATLDAQASRSDQVNDIVLLYILTLMPYCSPLRLNWLRMSKSN